MKTILTHAAAALCAFTALTAVAAPPDIKLPRDTSKLRPSSLPGFAIAMQKCAICHSADYIDYQPPGMSQVQWTAEVTKMQRLYGAPLNDDEVKQVGAYLAVVYGSAKQTDASIVAVSTPSRPAAPVKPVAAAAPPTTSAIVDVQALLARNACLGCHGLTQKVVGPGYSEVARKYKADPQAPSKLEASIRDGSAGKWGGVPMPPFAALKPEELKALAEFVLKQ